MPIDKKMEISINDQIHAEFQSSYLYLSMAAWFESQELMGCAHWMKKQADEEWAHGMKLYEYIVSSGSHVTPWPLDVLQSEWGSPTEVFAHVLAHEEKITSMIKAMVELAGKENDIVTKNLLDWFIEEQIEEEKQARETLAKFRKLDDKSVSLDMLDKEMGSRA